MANPSPETQARDLRHRLQNVIGRLSERRAGPSVLGKARKELAALADEAGALEAQSDAPEVMELVAEVLYQKASNDLGFSQGSLWFVLHPLLRRVATVGESTQRPRGLEVAAWAHLRMGECLVDFNDPEESPNDRGWGARELHEAIRLGRQAATRDGFIHAAQAGLRLARVMEEEGDPRGAAGLRDGVCATRAQALDALEGEERRAFESFLADALGEEPGAPG